MFSVMLAGMLSILTQLAAAQSPEMADTMRADGKIYVVVGIIVIVLIGLFVYLLLMDRKVSKLENRLAAREGKKS